VAHALDGVVVQLAVSAPFVPPKAVS
jgi:hypothetical protein